MSDGSPRSIFTVPQNYPARDQVPNTLQTPPASATERNKKSWSSEVEPVIAPQGGIQSNKKTASTGLLEEHELDIPTLPVEPHPSQSDVHTNPDKLARPRRPGIVRSISATDINAAQTRRGGEIASTRVSNRKRAAPVDQETSAQKKRRLQRYSRKPNQHGHITSNPHASDAIPHSASPLFFSDAPTERPHLPPRFSSSEAGATMMRKVQGEEKDGIYTVQLGRGAIVNQSPSRGASTGTPGSRGFGAIRQRSSVTPSSVTSYEPPRRSAETDLLEQVGVIELLDQDERPTFIIDLQNDENFRTGALQPLFANAALRSYTGLFELTTGISEPFPSSPNMTPSRYLDFKQWFLSYVKNQEALDVCLPSFLFGDLTWTCSTIRRRFRIVSGVYTSAHTSAQSSIPSETPAETVNLDPSRRAFSSTISPGSKQDSITHQEGYFDKVKLPSTTQNTSNAVMSTIEVPGDVLLPPPSASSLPDVDVDCFDWTRITNIEALPSHVQFARSIDWASTSLGPIENWSGLLRCMCNLIMASPHPSAMYWGPDLIAVCFKLLLLQRPADKSRFITRHISLLLERNIQL
jgi:hypothetical protein